MDFIRSCFRLRLSAFKVLLLGIISDVYIYRNLNRLSLYLFTLITAVIGVQLLAGSGFINPADSAYMNISDKTISSVFGGLLFGIGMTFCSGCTTSTLIKFGEEHKIFNYPNLIWNSCYINNARLSR